MDTEEVTEAPEEVETTPLEDIEVSLEDIADGNDTEAEVETETEEVEETESEEETTEETEEASTGETEEDTKDEDETQSSDEGELKQHNREMAEKRIQEKQARKAEEARIKKEQEDYILDQPEDNATTPAIRELQVKTYNAEVRANLSELKSSLSRALNDFPVLQSPDVQEDLNQTLDEFQALYAPLDAWGNPSVVNGDLYEYLQIKANSIERLTAIGAKKQEGSKAKEKSNATPVPSKTPKAPKSDPDMDAFNEEAYGKK